MLSVTFFAPIGLLDLLLGLITFVLLLRSRSLRAYWPMLFVALWQIIPAITLVWLREFRIFSAQSAYTIYFYVYWIVFAFAAFSSGLLTYTLFNETLRPLKGLQSLGQIMFRWILVITGALVLSVWFEPSSSAGVATVQVVSEAQRLSGIVTLGLIAFVPATVRPLGLTFRSRIFGVSLGMCVAIAANIITAGHLALSRDMYNQYALIVTCADCVAQMIWIWYFAVPEPIRKFLLLPTTSPFHQWNLVSERMGYDPGYVAIGGVPPESFADAERAIFERIAAQDSGRAPRLNEVETGEALPLGSSGATLAATERFNRIWNMRYGSDETAPSTPGR